MHLSLNKIGQINKTYKYYDYEKLFDYVNIRHYMFIKRPKQLIRHKLG